jgi:hypothetical protein
MQTKFKIVETVYYYLAVSDEKIEKGKTFLTKEGIVHTQYGYNYGDVVVIAHLPKNNAPELLYDVKIPSDENVNMQKVSRLPLLPEIIIEPRGFDEFQYTEQDMINLAKEISYNCFIGKVKDLSDYIVLTSNYIKSLNQPKTPTHFEADVKLAKDYHLTGNCMPIGIERKLKTELITGKERLVGKYLFE